MSEQPRTPKRRLWLDATRAESEGESSTVAAQAGASSVPAPPIPDPPRQRTHSPTPSAPEPKRRTGFGHYGRARRRNHKQRESPDPMLGLIDSLSTISRPPSDEFDAPPEVNGTVSAPVILRVRPVRSYGGGAESIASEGYASDFTKSLREEFANIDDAAEPPVIRMSKRPSGFSELTAPKPGPREHNSLRAYLRSSRSRSAISLTSNDDDAKSIGTISIENGHRRSIPGTERQSLESRASAKRGHHSLIAMSSRERLKGKEADRRRETISPDSAAIRMSAFEPDSTASTSPRHVFALDDPIKEEELTPPPAPASIPNSVASSSKKEGKKPKLVDDVSISSPLGGPAVPSRRSSLKMQDMPTPQRRGPHSRQSSGQHATVLKEEEEPEPEPQPQLGPATVEPKVNLADVLDGEDTEVTKRIKELKAKKEQREREAGQSPKIEPEPPNGKRYGPMATPGPSALSPHVSNARLEASGSGAKSRRKFEGAIDVPPRLSLKDTSKPVNGDEHLTSEKDSDPDQPGTPLTPTPLPINYSYVVKSLNRDSSPSSKVSENTRPSTAGREKGKSRSLIVGSRTSSARAHATRSLNIDTSGRKRSDSSPARPVNGVERPPPAQAPATGSPIASERTSLQTESTAPDLQQPTSKPKKSSSVKKKRISHPDLPASMDRTVNKKSDSLAVRPPNPPETVQEERPGTADSIDHQVNVFIRSPRLTQKIQHPQTGRIISFSEVGDPKGHAVFCCVGMGLTRYVTAFYDELASTLRLRLITPDRPGVGESPVDPLGTPLSWPDDILAISTALHISKFSLIAHSAGAIYALATALRMPQNIRGRVHLLAPWIPPSQMAPIGLPKQVDAPPAAALPRGQRFLRVLPAPLLKVANTGLFSAASASLSPNGSQKPKRRSLGRDRTSTETPSPASKNAHARSPSQSETPAPPPSQRRESIMLMDQQALPNGEALAEMRSNADLRAASKKTSRTNGSTSSTAAQRQRDAALKQIKDEERRAEYDERLTIAIWNAATSNANPAVDLIVCLERNQPIGFRYVDITRAVVIHHGAKDTRVPVENVKWLGRTMRRCEVRVLDGEGHGLMANAGVMGGVLGEMSREWEDWERAVKSGRAEGDKLRDRIRQGVD